MNPQNVIMIRADLPSEDGGAMYFFIDPRHSMDWHPWWGELFSFLLTLNRIPAGISSDGEPMDVALLSGENRREFKRLVSAAPASEITRHRTLRAVLRWLDRHEMDITVRFFNVFLDSTKDETQA